MWSVRCGKRSFDWTGAQVKSMINCLDCCYGIATIVHIPITLKLPTIISIGQKQSINKQLRAGNSSSLSVSQSYSSVTALPFSSWEILTFSPRVVVFIRICGTHNTANEVFHCVHFECPCRPDVLEAYLKEQSSIVTTDEREPNSVTFEEFDKHFRPLIEATNATSNSASSSSSSIDNQSILQNPTILPFTTKPGSAALYALEKSS